MKKKYIAICTGISALLSSATLNAQITESDTVVVSASRFEENRFRAAGNITLVSRKDIEQSGAVSLGQLLQLYTGMNLIGANQAPGSVTSLFMRGAGNNQTVVMIDGVRITDPSSPDNTVNLAELSLTAVERVEIFRGAAGTSFGTGTIGGVVNIITRGAAANGLQISGNLNTGYFGKMMTNPSVRATYKDSASGIYGTVEWSDFRTDGINSVDDTSHSAFPKSDRDAFAKSEIWGRAGIRREKTHAYIQYRFNTQTADIDDGAWADDDNNLYRFRRNLINAHAEHSFTDQLKLILNSGFSRVNRSQTDDSSLVSANAYDGAFSDSRYTSETVQNDLYANWKAKGIDIAAGLSQYSEKMDLRNRYFSSVWQYSSATDYDTLNIRSGILGAFGNIRLNGGLLNENINKIDLHLGGRFSRHNRFGNNFTWAVSPVWMISRNLMAYGRLATSFNAPALYRMFAPEKDFMSGIALGNPDLKPELGLSRELGVKYRLAKSFRAGASVFRNEVRNAIQYVYLWQSKPVDSLGFSDARGSTYLNLGTVTQEGFEIEAEGSWKGFVLAAGFTKIGGKLRMSPEDVAANGSNFSGGKYLVQTFEEGVFINREANVNGLLRRNNTLNARLSKSLPHGLEVSLRMRHVSRRSDVFYDYARGPYGALGRAWVNAYTLWDASVNWTMSEKLGFSLRCENITDQKYREIIGYNTMPRVVYLSCRFQLN